MRNARQCCPRHRELKSTGSSPGEGVKNQIYSNIVKLVFEARYKYFKPFLYHQNSGRQGIIYSCHYWHC